MLHYDTLRGVVYKPKNKMDLSGILSKSVYGYGCGYGGKIKTLPEPIDEISENISTGSFGSVPAALISTLAGIILPTISALIIKKFIDKNLKNDKEAVREADEIIKMAMDEDDSMDEETTSLLNKIIGRGIMEI